MHYANASPVQRFNEADSLIEYDPPANGIPQYNGIADSLSFQPTATRSSSIPPLPSREGLDSSLKLPETMQNTNANAPSSIHPFISPSVVGARSNSLHSSPGSFPTACYMVHHRYGPTPNAAHYPVAQSTIAYPTMGPPTAQQVTYPTLQSVSSNVQGVGDDSDPYPLPSHGTTSNLLLGGSCGHQTLHSSSTSQSTLPYPEDSSAITPGASHLHAAQYPTSTFQTNICYNNEGSAPPSLFNSTPYSPTVATAGDAATNSGDINAPYCQPYQQPYPGAYSVPIGSEGHRTQMTNSCHGRPLMQSPIIHNDSASCYPPAECNHNALPPMGLLGQASHILPNPASSCKFPTAPAWASSHSALPTSASPPHASPAHSVSSGQQELLMGSHCSISSNTAHSSTSTSPIAILTPHSDSTAYLSDQRSLSQSEPQSPLSPYVQHAPGSQCIPVSPQYSEYSPVAHQPVTAYKGVPFSNLPSARYDGPDGPVVGSYTGRSPLLPIYNVAHDRSMPSHNPCQGISHHHQHGIHFTPCYPPISSNPTDSSVTVGYPAVTMPMHPYPDHRPQRCFGACCNIEHDADDSDEPHAYAFIHNARETKKRPRRKFEEIVRNYACAWTGCTKAYGTLNHLNAHITNSGHGTKRDPSEFKELRKLWRKQKQDAEMEELLRNARGRPRARHEVVKASISQLEQST